MRRREWVITRYHGWTKIETRRQPIPYPYETPSKTKDVGLQFGPIEDSWWGVKVGHYKQPPNIPIPQPTETDAGKLDVTSLCCICGKELKRKRQARFWVCLDCRKEYDLAKSIRDWPKWIRKLKREEKNRRDYARERREYLEQNETEVLPWEPYPDEEDNFAYRQAHGITECLSSMAFPIDRSIPINSPEKCLLAPHDDTWEGLANQYNPERGKAEAEPTDILPDHRRNTEAEAIERVLFEQAWEVIDWLAPKYPLVGLTFIRGLPDKVIAGSLGIDRSTISKRRQELFDDVLLHLVPFRDAVIVYSLDLYPATCLYSFDWVVDQHRRHNRVYWGWGADEGRAWGLGLLRWAISQDHVAKGRKYWNYYEYLPTNAHLGANRGSFYMGREKDFVFTPNCQTLEDKTT